MIQVNYKMTRAELNVHLGPKALQLAQNEAVSVIRKQRPQWTAAMADAVSWDILRTIDWNNSAVMHKDFKWLVRETLKRLCPEE